MSGNAERQVGRRPEGQDARKFLRKRSLLPATLVTEGNSVDCRVLDFSAGGAKLDCADAPAEGEAMTLMIEAVGTFSGQVIWRGERYVGVKFDTGTKKSGEASAAAMPALTPLGTDSQASALALETDPGSLDEPELSAPITVCAPPATPEALSADETPTTPPTGPRLRRSRALKLKPHGEDVFTLAAGQPLFQEGDPGGRMYVVRAGTLRIQGGTPGEEEEIGSGAIVGEMELLEKDLRRRTTVIAVTECELMEIDARHFRQLIGERPDFALAVMHALSGRLRHMRDLRVGDGTEISPRDRAAVLGAAHPASG